MKAMMLFQLPMPLVPCAKFRRPYFDICYILMAISSRLVRKEKSGAKGKAVVKKAMKPSWIAASL